MNRTSGHKVKPSRSSRGCYSLIIPTVLTAAVAAVTYYRQTFTLLGQEGLGLFLNTPDFYGELLSGPLPISRLAGSFIVQFYSSYILAAVIFTAMVAGTYFIFRGIFSRLGMRTSAFPALCSCIAWWFMAGAEDPSTGTAVLLISGLFLTILSIFRKKAVQTQAERWYGCAISAVIIAGTACAVTFNSRIQEREKWSRIEFAGVQGNWDYVLKYATPEEARKDMEVVPWGLLALNIQGRLEKEFTSYPLTKDFGLDYGEGQSYRASLFYALLYSRLGVYNESVHKLHQSGGYLPHGTSFRTLRMLVQENYKLQDSLMVVKYCDILERSTLHGDFVRYFRENPCPQRRPSSYGEQGTEPLIVLTRNQMETMLQLGRAGLDSRMAMERYYCYYRISREE